MKKAIILLLGSVLITSCQLTERVNISEDGSIDYTTEFDFSGIIDLAYPESKKDSLRALGEFPIDTLLSFDELEDFEGFTKKEPLTDAEKKFLKAMDKVKVKMKIDDNEGVMGMSIQEKNIKTFNKYLEQLEAAVVEFKEEDPESASGLKIIENLRAGMFTYNGKVFEKIGTNNNLFLDEESSDESPMFGNDMMSMFTYKLEYSFPKRIKSSTFENATYSLDGKTMTVEISGKEINDDPKKGSFKVELED